MQPLSTAALFDIWEQTLGYSLLSKSLILLQASINNKQNNVAELSIGERDAGLLLLREWLFGSKMTHTASCPKCNEKMEWETTTTAMRAQPVEYAAPKILEFKKDNYKVQFRLMNSNDISGLFKDGISLELSTAYLMQNCVLHVAKSGKLIDKIKLPEYMLQAIEEEMSAQDPQADIQLNLICPNCHHQWQSAFDIMSFFWTEINYWAHGLMEDVLVLARNLGWAEKDILEMSPKKRQL